jgi:hypothetical protein
LKFIVFIAILRYNIYIINIKKYLVIINKIEKIRKKNNINWMNILRLAFKKSPEEASILMQKIYQDDGKISKLVKKLSSG